MSFSLNKQYKENIDLIQRHINYILICFKNLSSCSLVIYLSINISFFYLYINLSIFFLSIYQSIYLFSIYVYINLSIFFLSLYQSIYLFNNISFYKSIYLFFNLFCSLFLQTLRASIITEDLHLQ